MKYSKQEQSNHGPQQKLEVGPDAMEKWTPPADRSHPPFALNLS